MKHVNKILFSAVMAMVVTAVFTTKAVVAQSVPKATIAIVDIRKVGSESAAGQDIQRQVREIREAFEAQLLETQKVLQKEQEELKSQRAVMPQATYESKAKEFQAKVVNLERSVQARRNQIEQAVRAADSELQRALKPILQDVMQEAGATMIMDKSMIIEHADGLDVSVKVRQRLDAVLKNVKVQLPVSAAQ